MYDCFMTLDETENHRVPGSAITRTLFASWSKQERDGAGSHLV
jgi:hypothetical protein